jgi:hypothetical protein
MEGVLQHELCPGDHHFPFDWRDARHPNKKNELVSVLAVRTEMPGARLSATIHSRSFENVSRT